MHATKTKAYITNACNKDESLYNQCMQQKTKAYITNACNKELQYYLNETIDHVR